jgi:phage host-nuclease inhibitor protein Gam
MHDIIEILHDPEVKRFEVKDLDTANWAIGKMLKAHDRIIVREAQAQAYKHRIDEWMREANKEDAQTLEFFESELRPFVQSELVGSKKKSVKLLYGTAGFRTPPDHVDIEDEEAALDYCRKFAPELIRVKETIDKAEIRKRLAKGEVFDGVKLTRGETRFYVNIEEDVDE